MKKANKLEGDTKGESRNRVLSDSELKTLLNEIRDNRFNLFVRFAYYTGARSGEIRSISREYIFSKHIVAYGKSGKRLIKLNTQAQKILDDLDELWNYSKDFVSHKFKKEARRLGIPDVSGYGTVSSLSLELYNNPYLDNKLSYYIIREVVW